MSGATASLWAAPALAVADRLADVEARADVRLGVAALDVASGARVAHRAGERFAMASTFKLMATVAVLARVDRGLERLDRFMPYGVADLSSWAPVTREHVSEGGMRLGDLCAAAVQFSDNTAANLILEVIGGPAGWTTFVRSMGDQASRLDRSEPELNSDIPGDARDTTTPNAMLYDVMTAVLGKRLSPGSRDSLIGWMVECKTGLGRLRAGLPKDWRVGDKTGSSANGTTGDLALAWAPSGPIVIACYVSGRHRPTKSGPDDVHDHVHAEVGRIVAETFRPAVAGGAYG